MSPGNHLLLLLILTSMGFCCSQEQNNNQNIDYCNTSLCRDKGPHIACNNNRKIHSSCASYSQIIPIIAELKNVILQKHNELRNMVACGKVPDFPTATRMATMQWSDELAGMADLNVKMCTGAHDRCRNIPKYPSSGQNIGTVSFPSNTISVGEMKNRIRIIINEWFKEHTTCPRTNILTYSSEKKPNGHFMVMVRASNTHVGCALLFKKKQGLTFTCNYSKTNINRTRIYNAGPIASKCKTGTNKNFPGLCSVDEEFK